MSTKMSLSPHTSREALAAAKVLVVGDVMLDRYWFGNVERISPEAPVPIVHVQHSEERLGGAANVAYNISALGSSSALLCVIGNDEPGKRVLDLLEKSNVATYVQRDPELPTTIKLRVISRQQQLIRIDFENTPRHEVLLDALDQFKNLIVDYPVIILSDYSKGGLTHVHGMISEARALNKLILVDPKGHDYERYRGATLMTPNRSELMQVVGPWQSEEDLTTRAQNLRAHLDLKALLLTRSEEGMTLSTEEQVVHIPAEVREVYDVSGAGDTVIAVLASLLSSGMALEQAVYHANRAGGIVVAKLGTASIQYAELFGD